MTVPEDMVATPSAILLERVIALRLRRRQAPRDGN